MSIFSAVASKVSAQPLLLAQAYSSAAGALAMVMAAVSMAPEPFTTFSLLVLTTQLCTGAARALLFQPALIETRNNASAHVHVRVALAGALVTGLCFLAAAGLLGVEQPRWLAALSISSALPVISEWLRLRGMALDERWSVAHGDAIRLVTTMLGVVVLLQTTRAEVFFLFVNASYATTLIFLASRLPRVAAHLSPLQYWRSASSQLADFMLSQTISTIPLLVLASFEPSSYIGGIRMAQTLLGPLNLVVQASAMNLLADGATKDDYANPAVLIRRGRRLGNNLAIMCVVLVVSMLIILLVTNIGLRGVDNQSLTVGVLLTGAYSLTAALSYPDTVILRLLGHHTSATIGRLFVVALTAAGYTAGYVVGGVDASLIVAFACSAVANPLAFTLPATIVYRRYR